MALNALFLLLIKVIFIFQLNNSRARAMEFKLTKTWDDGIPLDKAEITISISSIRNCTLDKNGVLITVDAPFYDDPKLPEEIASIPGRVDGLWDYEVVEVFFLGEEQKYLEIELGPRGHYLLYFLNGVRNPTIKDLNLTDYTAKIYDSAEGGRRWTGKALIPVQFLPPNVSKFNAYAIHKSGEARTYMSLFPVPQGKFTDPDFHRLEYFGSIDL